MQMFTITVYILTCSNTVAQFLLSLSLQFNFLNLSLAFHTMNILFSFSNDGVYALDKYQNATVKYYSIFVSFVSVFIMGRTIAWQRNVTATKMHHAELRIFGGRETHIVLFLFTIAIHTHTHIGKWFVRHTFQVSNKRRCCDEHIYIDELAT